MKIVVKLIVLLFFSISLFSCFGGGSKDPNNEMSYHGVSFEYPSYWKAEVEELGETRYYIKCYERFSKGTCLLVSFFEGEGEPKEMLEDYLDNIGKTTDVTSEPMGKSLYGDYDCVSVSYKLSVRRAKSYGMAYALNYNNKSFLIVEQSERHYNLKHDKYKLIRNSFLIGEPTETAVVDSVAVEK